ncbi:MAG: hypothetical protein PHN88_11295 [Ignavibacteria bacterium]|nr:hypothetical protein [Ignavibacteria bacterium]
MYKLKIFAYLSLYFSILLSLSSCNNKEEADLSKSFDSLSVKTVKDSAVMNDTANFDNALQIFAGNYKAITNWSAYDKSTRASFRKAVTGKYIIVPITKQQAESIRNSEFTDTSLVHFGMKNNVFVFIVSKGGNKIEKLTPGKNGLLLLKVRDVDDALKLYLEKKSTDFMHKERKLTEFTVTAELIEAVNIDISENALKNKFELE